MAVLIGGLVITTAWSITMWPFDLLRMDLDWQALVGEPVAELVPA